MNALGILLLLLFCLWPSLTIGQTDQEATTTYIIGRNPWRAFIAEVAPRSPSGRVEPPDFAPLANLPADLFPDKTLRLLEQAVWHR